MNEVHPLYTEKFDLNQNLEDSPEVIKSAICFHFVPRSGSNYLSDLLFQSKTLGVPLEYFSPSNYNYLMGRLGSFESLVKARLSEFGCFSFKWNSNFENIPIARQAYQKIAPTKHIFIDRRDKLGQAVSYARALKSKQWFRAMSMEAKNVVVSEKEIVDAQSTLNSIRKSTIRRIEENGIDYLTIMFEDLMENPKSCIELIYRHCEIEKPQVLPEKPIALLPSSDPSSNATREATK